MKTPFTTTLLLTIAFGIVATAQNVTKKVLFLGNSYTASNNLPLLIANVANSTGDTVIYDSRTPGGYTLQEHANNSTSLGKIGANNWDFVVLQEQSQLPAFPTWQVQNYMYPYATFLDEQIREKNPCAETIFYMTWGRKNGDASNCGGWPPMCTYESMDDLIQQRYMTMANDNEAIVSPVGAVWRYIRQHHPEIELYVSDGSHPSVAGSYAAACAFYTTIFRKDPLLITFNSSLSADVAQKIRQATNQIMWNNLIDWNIGLYDPTASFSYNITTSGEITFSNQSQFATTYHWDFGDGNTTTDEAPAHQYTAPGTYTISLTASHCGLESTTTQTIEINQLGMSESTTSSVKLYPNPSKTHLTIEVDLQQVGLNYRIVDSHGRELISDYISHRIFSIQLDKLASGVYFIQVGNHSQAIKFVKL